MERGDLVPDDLINAVALERLSQPDTKGGFVLDGFPRNEAQAEVLDKFLEGEGRSLSAVLLVDVPPEEVVKRLSGRRVCVKNQHVFHVEFDPPKHEGRCDMDGSRLEIRPDDEPEVVERRLDNYREQTEPLIGYYDRKGILRRIDGVRTTDEVSDQIRATLAALKFEEAV
jgi:adenylate kinase